MAWNQRRKKIDWESNNHSQVNAFFGIHDTLSTSMFHYNSASPWAFLFAAPFFFDARCFNDPPT